ncbi:MAG: family glycosyltransferase, 4-amino-4-deoxy-L-arabinose transferase [Phycisphaerales bacterium]|nr:family glycosyltransferase, 4-amino-4-deoxy-L-arabinose transferase [Phycisphaerales bacterium]
MSPARKPFILLTLLATAAFLPFLGRRDIVISHEARVVQTARQMAESGWPWNATPATVPAVRLNQTPGDTSNVLRLDPDPTAPPLLVNPWLIPVLNDEIRLQKPPLPYWTSAILFKLAGHWSEALARLIPALLGACSTLLIHDLAKRLLGRRYALPAALVWVTSYFIPDEFRKVMADPYLAFFSLLALWAWIRAAHPTPGQSAGSNATKAPSRIPLLLFYIAIALGLLSKGPIVLLHVPIPILLYHILHRRRRVPSPISLHLIGFAIFIAIALPWPIYILNHVPHAREIWRYESIGELTDNTENARPAWFYLPLLFQITLPWTPLWLLAIALPLRKLRTQHSALRTLFPLAWFTITVLFFSCVHLKKIAYLLPVMPAQTLIIAQALVFCAAQLRRRRHIPRRKLDETFIIACTLIVIALVGVFNFVRTPIENARSPRPAAQFLQLALRANPNATTIPGKLPPEATLYLPLSLAYDPQATTIFYLLDDPKNTAPTDLQSFAQRLPHQNLAAVARVNIPGEGPHARYKLFSITLATGSPKTFADARGI